MDNQKAEKIFDAVKKDNLKEFQSLIVSNSDLNICFGRFPLLSVCYLYKSYKILDKYEKQMMAVKTYTTVLSDYEIYKVFSKYAKKSIRLFTDDKIVEPIQMLAILDEREKIAKQYKNFYKNDEIVQKIEKIYLLTNEEYVVSTINTFEAPRKKYNFKQYVFMSVVSLILCLCMLFPVFSLIIISNKSGIGIASSPIKISNKKEFLSALSNGKRNYILETDIYLDKPVNINKFSGSLNGNNHKIIFTEKYTNYVSKYSNKPLIENLTGAIKNLNIELNFNELKISLDAPKNEEEIVGTSIIANTLKGRIENCKISGTIETKFLTSGDTYFSLFAVENNGKIKNSVADVEVVANNDSNQNAFLTAFAGVNNGEIINCKSEAKKFTVETVDVACFAIENNGSIKNSENNLEITQTSAKEWYPNTAGIAVNNHGNIIDTVNNGNITSESTNEKYTAADGNHFSVYSCGVAVNNFGNIENVTNNGEIIARGITSEIYASGIISNNYFDVVEENYELKFSKIGNIKNCTNNGDIFADSEGQGLTEISVYCSGIVAVNLTNVENATNTGTLTCFSLSTVVYAGGIIARSGVSINAYNLNLERKLINSKSECNINVTSEHNEIYVGGLVGYCDA